MSFDWSSFATGFMDTTVEIRDERQEEAKDYENEQRLAAERNAQVISRRRAIADQVTGYANYLQSNGVTDAQLQATISSGPQAIQALTERVQQAVQSNGGRPLGAADVDSIISMPQGFTPLDMTAQEFIDNTYGLSVPPSVREDQDFNFLDRLAGRDQMSRAQDRLNRTPIVEGMTIEEVNRAAMQGDYQSLIPGTFASIAGRTADPYDLDASIDFTNTLRRTIESVKDSRAYVALMGDEAARQQLLEDNVDAFIRRAANTYGDTFLAEQTPFLQTQLGEDYVTNLINDYTTATTTPATPAVPIPAAPVAPAVATPASAVAPTPVTPAAPVAPAVDRNAVDAAVRAALGEPPTATRIDTPQVTTTVLPPANATPAATPRAVPTNQAQFGDPLGQGVIVPPAQGAPSPAATPSATPIQEAAALNLPPETTAQFEQLRQEQRVYETLRAQGVDDMSINLLRTRGADMLQYAREAGASTREEIFAALNQYSQEKGVVLPLDPSPLVYAISNVLLDQQ